MPAFSRIGLSSGVLFLLTTLALLGCDSDGAKNNNTGSVLDSGQGDGGHDGDGGDQMSDGEISMGDGGLNQCPQCPGGRCLSDGTCVQCTESLPCVNVNFKCDFSRYVCVPCLPDADDCAAGTYCSPTTYTCLAGCKTGECPGGTCNEAHQCVSCTAEIPCDDPTLTCNVATSECVQCLPSADTCPAGQHCGDNFTCQPGGCKASECASGRCDPTMSWCETCVDDDECGQGQVCGTFECGVTCGNVGDCSGDANACCGSQCVDTVRDIQHCAGCDVACSASEFCGTPGCTAVALANLCANQVISVVQSGQTGDAEQSLLLAAELGPVCTSSTVRNIDLAHPDRNELINTTKPRGPNSGRPLAGGNDLLVTLGSSATNDTAHYLEAQRIAPLTLVINEQNGTVTWRRNAANPADDKMVLPAPIPMANEFGHPDATQNQAHFVIQLVRDPATGSLVLLAYGVWAEGTAVANWFLMNEVLPNLSTFTKTAYVYRWVSSNGLPDALDDFNPVHSQ